MKIYILTLIFILFNISYSNNAFYNIYISTDRTGSKESGISIEQGVRTALSEVDNMINNKAVNLIILDHRGSTPRSNKHLKKFLEDENALVIFAGLHSPPLLSARDFINENKILMLDPWAAAASITRYPSENNWIFRLSIDDAKAGSVISNFAIKEGYKNPYLILENTGWGKSNNKTMAAALNNLGIAIAGSEVFNWGIGVNQAKVILRRAKLSGADVIFFVGNSPEGKIFMKGLSELEESERLPVRSHWGITGGDFATVINKDIRNNIDLKFLQTSFSFMDRPLSPLAKEVFDRAKRLFPHEIKMTNDIKAPTGFIHAYDLTKIFLQAIMQSELTGIANKDREIIRTELENINVPVHGLIKTYIKPFSKFTIENIDAHEALSDKDFRMAEYGKNNEIFLIKMEK